MRSHNHDGASRHCLPVARTQYTRNDGGTSRTRVHVPPGNPVSEALPHMEPHRDIWVVHGTSDGGRHVADDVRRLGTLWLKDDSVDVIFCKHRSEISIGAGPRKQPLFRRCFPVRAVEYLLNRSGTQRRRAGRNMRSG